MSILATELIWRKSAEQSDAGTNGGRMTATAITSAVKNNLFPDIPQSERTAGVTRYRKAFIHVANDADLALIDPKVFILAPTAGDDFIGVFLGTQTDQQSGIGAPQVYGAGNLNADVNVSDTTVDVLVEDWAAMPIFADGMKIRITNKQSVDDVSGTVEYHTIAAGGVSAVGNVITLTLDGTSLAYAYSASNSFVSSCLEPGDVEASSTTPVVTGGGSYDNGTYPVLLDSIGSIQQNWTGTFTSASAVTIVGDTVGSLGSFNISSDVAPDNPDFTKPYFTLDALGWSGTQTGTEITFTTTPAAVPVWYKQIVPAGAASLSGNKVILGVDGESA